jgi:hypothetical protein
MEPMTTVGWLLNHFGAAPGLFAELEIVGGTTVPTLQAYEQMWSASSPPWRRLSPGSPMAGLR